MAYAQEGTNAVEPKSLINDGLKMVARLSEIRHRIEKLGDTLQGPSPRDASAKADTPEPEPSLRRHIDAAERLLSDIEGEITRIETKL